MRHSEETRKKLKEARLRFFANGGKHPRLGVKVSESTKSKISESMCGVKHPQWKGGKFNNSSGYVWIHKPKHPLASKVSPVGYVLEHRFVMCEKLNRIIKSDEIVHHINGVRNDNRIENLVITTKSKHVSEHNKERIHTKESNQKHRDYAKIAKRGKSGKFIKN